MLEELQGQIERVTFHNEENGFTIARLKVTGFRELVTAIGHLIAPVPGQVLRVEVHDPFRLLTRNEGELIKFPKTR